MKRIGTMLVGLVLVLAAGGCYETKQEVTLNPDGTGKIAFEAVFQELSINLNGADDEDPEEAMKAKVGDILERSEGIEAWRDVRYRLRQDGRIHFTAVAYFRDLSAVKFHNLGMMSFEYSQDQRGRGVLVLEDQEDNKEGKTTAALSEAELAAKIKQEKVNFQKARPMLTAFLSGMRSEVIFRLPGRVMGSSNFEKMADGRLRVVWEGEKMLALVDELVADDDWWAAQAIHDDDKKGKIYYTQAFNEKMFGENGPVRAVAGGKLKALFDYEQEVAVAKANYKGMLKEIGLGDLSSSAVRVKKANTGDEGAKDGVKTSGGFKALTVGGVRIVRVADDERGIRPLYQDKGFTLSLVGEFTEDVLDVTEGKVLKAVGDNGENLLLERDWDRQIHTPELTDDKQAVVFDVKLALPSAEVAYLKEVSGTLTYLTSSGTRKLDLGIGEFKAGATGSAYGATVAEIKKHDWKEGEQILSLRLRMPREALKSIVFYGADGSLIDFSKSGSMEANKEVTTFDYSVAGQWPGTGKVEVEVYEGLVSHDLSFTLEDVSFSGSGVE